MVPFVSLLIPIFIELNKAGLIGELPALMIAYLAPTLPFTIWTLRGFIAAVPADVEEAALTDGCSRFGAFRKVLFPLIAPGLVATAIFGFILAWNDFAFASVLTNGSDETATVWLVGSHQPQPGDPVGGAVRGLAGLHPAGDDLLHHHPAPARRRTDGGGGEGMIRSRGAVVRAWRSS